MEKSKKNWVMLGIAVLAVFLLIKIAIDNFPENQTGQDKVYCPNDRGEFCTEEYNPVCGFYNPEQIQCIKYPCAQTYSNGCFACLDKNIQYYTKGSCPK